jgi:hypothetical protein
MACLDETLPVERIVPVRPTMTTRPLVMGVMDDEWEETEQVASAHQHIITDVWRQSRTETNSSCLQSRPRIGAIHTEQNVL